MIIKYPETINIIKNLPKNSPEEIHKKKADYMRTVLMIACLNGNNSSSVECVKLLIEYDANVNDKEYSEWTSLL